MKEPKKIPLNPETPRAKTVSLIKMPASSIMPDNDSIYIPIKDKSNLENENTTEGSQT